ncbi:unnamed protein product [Linum tenue]|uniref:Uncharacterized protein n=1 Tax=Linum tenue TaxID=586396 RepID=A0AAV0IQG4_9ROSI|nr:unnamed protein product [Linum tenue]
MEGPAGGFRPGAEGTRGGRPGQVYSAGGDAGLSRPGIPRPGGSELEERRLQLRDLAAGDNQREERNRRELQPAFRRRLGGPADQPMRVRVDLRRANRGPERRSRDSEPGRTGGEMRAVDGGEAPRDGVGGGGAEGDQEESGIAGDLETVEAARGARG